MNTKKQLKEYGESDRALLNDKAAAELLGVATHTLRVSRCTGILLGIPGPQYLKFNKAVRYQLGDLKEWISRIPRVVSTSDSRLSR